ncbi:MAG: pyridoxal 5'-phosphate synthase glutaminase subunit PdxT [Alphaproteobacteria bacterium]
MIGVLALQGDFAAHEAAIARTGNIPLLVRDAAQFGQIDGLIIPGGESTAMLKLLHYDGLMEALIRFASEKPVFGTCAGAILLAKNVSNPPQQSLNVVDIDIERNAYGRQRDSCIVEIDPEPEFLARTRQGSMEAVLIRAPVIRRVGARGKILARHDGHPVLVEQDRHMVATFHPELTDDTRAHALFAQNCLQ